MSALIIVILFLWPIHHSSAGIQITGHIVQEVKRKAEYKL